MRFRVAARTDVGRVRSQNEDAFLRPDDDSDPRLVAVADGMGGHEGGEVASNLALEVLGSWEDRLETRGGQALRDAVQDANRTVWSRGRSEPTLHGMGTTLTAAWIEGSRVTLAHVGDSRAYLLRGDQLEQLTIDHTLVQQLLDEGSIDEEEAARHPQRNVVTQAIGSEPDVRVEISDFELQPGDRLVLSSDGLHGAVSPSQLREILAGQEDADEACRRLVDAANEAGGHDNITVLILEAVGEDGEETAGAGPVIVSKPPLRERTSAAGRRNRLIVAGVVALVFLAGAFWLATTFLRSATTRYIVTADGGRVVIMQGTPGRNGRPPSGRIVERTDVEVATLTATYQRQLNRGIDKPTLAEARQVVASIPRQLGP
ncbi:MAG TPA: Stp1/IreP family PP2C-type Ser/Thr phosphatase, partial [Actinomycetota bacterium]|nr:Stp1/IreP family PP2C-type Ser/Thr phosphatase [Actinomycetota bacterium]